MDLDTLRTAVDMGLGGVALLLYYRQGKILQNHETRLRLVERQVKSKRRR